MSNSNHRVSMKSKMSVFIAGGMFAITAAMPASATVSNTNGQNLTGEQQSTQLLAAKGGGKRPASSSPEPGGSSKKSRLDSPEVVKKVETLPPEVKLEIMENMTPGTYEGMKRLWKLPDATPRQQEKMQKNKDDLRMEQMLERLIQFNAGED